VSAPVSMHERVAALLDRTSALEAAMRVRRVLPMSTVSVVTFHRIAELDPDEPYDPDVIDATPAQLRRHVETLARLGTPISMAALLAALDGAALPPNPILITFDDGYRSCRDAALPILRALGVPATFFIATGFAAAPRLYWWEQIAAIVARAGGRVGELRYPRPIRVDTADPRVRHMLDAIVKDTPGLDLERFLAALREALGVAWDPQIEAELAAPLIMGWADVRALAAAGMDVESHTRWHRVLETLAPDELREELLGSRLDLEAQLGHPVRAIAYPVGRRPPAWIRRAVADAGYRVGFTNASGVNHRWPAGLPWARPIDPFDLHRLATERTCSDALFLAQIAVPPLAYVNR
jgi:peptidoglycan/xylan/chitin deacetylase (PgdA/CDA1 family)